MMVHDFTERSWYISLNSELKVKCRNTIVGWVFDDYSLIPFVEEKQMAEEELELELYFKNYRYMTATHLHILCLFPKFMKYQKKYGDIKLSLRDESGNAVFTLLTKGEDVVVTYEEGDKQLVLVTTPTYETDDMSEEDLEECKRQNEKLRDTLTDFLEDEVMLYDSSRA